MLVAFVSDAMLDLYYTPVMLATCFLPFLSADPSTMCQYFV